MARPNTLPPQNRHRAPGPNDLLPVDWGGLEPDYRSGLTSITAMARKYGVSRAAIYNRAKRYAWQRDLSATIHETANRMLDTAALGEVAEMRAAAGLDAQSSSPSDAAIVDAGAKQIVLVRLEHRQDIAALRRIVASLMAELAMTIDAPDRFAVIYDALSRPNEPAIDALRDMATLVASLPARTTVAKNLADALFRCIGLEREAYGLDTAAGSDGRPTVIIKDYTGRGSPEAPPMPAIEA